jgi:dephospho-CoA kinase
MKLIIVAGMPGAGKEELLTVARSMGIPFLRMGDLVREGYASRSSEDENLSTGQYANVQRERHGKDYWAECAVKRMSGNVFYVDGCRSMDEVDAYRRLTDDVHLIGIFASPVTRYERLLKRGRDDAPKDLDDFKARDIREMGWGLAVTLALADTMIVNEGTLEQFRLDSERTLKEVIG